MRAIYTLYRAQSLPEARRMLIKNQTGLITIIVWAYNIFSLSVVIMGFPGGDVRFGKDTAQVCIHWDAHMISHLDVEVCLLDATMQVLFKKEPGALNMERIAAEERHGVEGFGTLWLRRACDISISLEDNDAVYREIANYTTAMAFHAAKRIYRGREPRPSETGDSRQALLLPLERWQIFDAAEILLHEIGIEESAVDMQDGKGCTALTLESFLVLVLLISTSKSCLKEIERKL